MANIAIRYLPPSDLKPYPAELRKHTGKKLKKLRKSIAHFDVMMPILIDAQGAIIDGHARLAVALQDRLERVPTISAEGLSETEVKALRLAMNRLQDEATWQPKALKLEFQSLLAFEIDLDLTGFDAYEIDMTQDVAPAAPGDIEELSTGELNTEKPPVTQAGDIFRLGEHRIGCGNCQDEKFVQCVLGGRIADVAFADPPYNVPVRGHVSSLPHSEFAMASGEMSKAEFHAFLKRGCSAISLALRPGGVAFICMDWRGIAVLETVIPDAGLETLNLAVWVKTNPGMGSLYRSQHEFITVCKHKGASHRNNVDLGKNGRSRSNVWTYRGVNVMGPERQFLYEHPTVKPSAMIADALKDVSLAGSFVFDPFLGPGSTLIAAERTSRRCLGVEIEPKYVDLTIRRWQAETGQDAVRERDGRTFNDLANQSERPDTKQRLSGGA